MEEKRAFPYYNEPGEDVSVRGTDVIKDPNFIEASKILYRKQFGKDHRDTKNFSTDEEVAKWGLGYMGDFNYNIVTMVTRASAIQKGTPEQQQAFLYLMDSYDSLDSFTLDGSKRMALGLASDPTTYIGALTLGVGLFAKSAARTAKKKAIRKALNSSISLGLQGSAYGFAGSTATQQAQIAGGKLLADGTIKTEIDTTQRLQETALGAVAPVVLNKTVHALKYAAVDPLIKKFKKPKDKPEVTVKPKTPEEIKEEEDFLNIFRNNKTVLEINDFIKEFKETVGIDPVGVIDNIQNYKVVGEAADKFTTRLIQIGINDKNVGDVLFSEGFTKSQQQVLGKLLDTEVKKAQDMQVNLLLKSLDGNMDSATRKQNKILAEKIDDVRRPLEDLRKKLTSQDGRDLAIHRTYNYKGDTNLEWNDIFPKKGEKLSDEQVDHLIDAHNQFSDESIKTKINTEIVKASQKIEKAVDDFNKGKGTREDIVELLIERDVLEQRKIESKLGGRGWWYKLQRAGGELMVTNVLSQASTVRNWTPSFVTYLFKPLSNFISQGAFDPIKLRGLVATYKGQFGVFRQAIKNARLAFRYEKALLTGTDDKYLEVPPVFKKAYLNGKIPGLGLMRIWNRALLATDSFYETSFYRGIIEGKYTEEFAEKGIKAGKTNKELADYIEKNVNKKIKSSYEFSYNGLKAILADGKNRGYKGVKLKEYVNKELTKNEKGLIEGSDSEALNEVLDMLFKRSFSKKTNLGKLANVYEQQVARNPILRILGQVFFRTPIRLAEFSGRLTPGLQFFVPGFQKDLKGLNGTARQARALSELNGSQLIVAAILTKYVQGEVRGAPYNWAQGQMQTDDPSKGDPYSIDITVLGKKRTINFNYLSPFSEPIKIMVNVLTYLEDLEYRKEAGEFFNYEEEYEFTADYAKLAWLGFVKAYRDMNLFGLVDKVGSIFDELDDTDTNSVDDLLKFFSQTVSSMIPFQGSVKNFGYYSDPTVHDPIYPDEFAESIFGKFRKESPTNFSKKYTMLGRPREVVDVKGKALGVDAYGYPISLKEKVYKEQIKTELQELGRKPSKDLIDRIYKEEAKAHDFLFRLSKATGTAFLMKPENKLLPGVRLNTVEVYIKDRKTKKLVKRNLMDLYVRQMREEGLTQLLIDLSESDLPFGNQNARGLAYTTTKQIISEISEIAMSNLLDQIEVRDTPELKTFFGLKNQKLQSTDLLNIKKFYQEIKPLQKIETAPPFQQQQ